MEMGYFEYSRRIAFCLYLFYAGKVSFLQYPDRAIFVGIFVWKKEKVQKIFTKARKCDMLKKTEKEIVAMAYRYHFDRVQIDARKCVGVSLLQYGELLCDPQTEIAPHNQWCFELTFCLAGQGSVTTGEVTHLVRAGDLVLSFPEELHAIQSADAPMRFAFFGFEPAGEAFAYLFAKLRRLCSAQSARKVRLTEQTQTVFRIFSELESGALFGDESAGYLLAQLLIAFLRGYTEAQTTSYFPLITDDRVLVYTLQTYLAQNVRTLGNLQTLSERFSYDYRSLAAKYRAVTGESLGKAFLRLKMKEADRLLAEGCTVTQVAEQLHYATVHSFSRSYKQYFGFSPKERAYRLPKTGELPEQERKNTKK